MSVNNNVDVINIMEIIERVENFAREYDIRAMETVPVENARFTFCPGTRRGFDFPVW